ncbi:hypothetical protein HDU76_001658 [Blyttiomyces sp. JEL0837]|nr:hypothetical protein HDU76_001658 [Blyttiomyces sp. JEL0837]
MKDLAKMQTVSIDATRELEKFQTLADLLAGAGYPMIQTAFSDEGFCAALNLFPGRHLELLRCTFMAMLDSQRRSMNQINHLTGELSNLQAEVMVMKKRYQDIDFKRKKDAEADMQLISQLKSSISASVHPAGSTLESKSINMAEDQIESKHLMAETIKELQRELSISRSREKTASEEIELLKLKLLQFSKLSNKERLELRANSSTRELIQQDKRTWTQRIEVPLNEKDLNPTIKKAYDTSPSHLNSNQNLKLAELAHLVSALFASKSELEELRKFSESIHRLLNVTECVGSLQSCLSELECTQKGQTKDEQFHSQTINYFMEMFELESLNDVLPTMNQLYVTQSERNAGIARLRGSLKNFYSEDIDTPALVILKASEFIDNVAALDRKLL